MADCIELDRIVFIGRTFREYCDMFGLDKESLSRGPVLDCPAGPSSFTAEAQGTGVNVTGCDVLYGLPMDELMAKGEEDIRLIHERVDGARHLYDWGYYGDKNGLIAMRKKALALFRMDYPEGRRGGRYVEAALPHLPFADRKFSLVLSGHLLFLYGDRLDIDFHIASLRELLRVSSGEVRVFPLLGLDSRPYGGLGQVKEALDAEGIACEIKEVPFEFQRGGNMMMRLRRKD